MTYNQAISLVNQGKKCRRPSWQPSWIELGIFQGKSRIFYKANEQMVYGYLMPDIYCTYTPYRNSKTGYPEDEQAKDWVEFS